MSHPHPVKHFQYLIGHLSEKLGVPIDTSEGTVVLVNDDQSLGMVIELSSDHDGIFVILPILPFPAAPAQMGDLAMEALLLNADRQALAGACLCADAHRSQFCLIQSLSLITEPGEFLAILDELTALADLVRDHLLNTIEMPSPLPARAAFDLHA